MKKSIQKNADEIIIMKKKKVEAREEQSDWTG